ncbi:hypothetical protein SAMN05444149_1081 [Pseudosulfitobacter pseudonitzschiae]|uniref:hypothetical protein n=1 Tax=Pseudosulfitobacter pseudonitzschiae TaxID=1402135 RepID=UPI00091A76AD|nr:hypothetical protein [Pseudosulfitobacter pseudonitzschiae]QKS07218.1 hypothetical protein HT745_01315 [Pseudosulfitobacter pseudonitzschiae]SHF98939.1 hypothetical protein SAMN05444149_1081 [Pseudosulfitobacter pseudonitzschiae]
MTPEQQEAIKQAQRRRAVANAQERRRAAQGITPEQQSAIRRAQQRLAIQRAQASLDKGQTTAEPTQERGFGAALYDNVIGNPDDGVQSYGESLGTWLNRAGESMTLGLGGDELSGAVYAPAKRALAAVGLGGDAEASYESERDRFRANEEGMSGVGKFSADVTGSVVPAILGLGVVKAAPTIWGAIGRGAGLGATAGGTQGFMEGEGGFSDREVSGGIGAGAGAVVGGAIPPAAAFGKQVYRTAQGAFRNSRIGKEIGDQFGVSPEAGRVVSRLVGEENPAAMQDAIRRAGPNAMLADASPNMSGMLDASMRNPAPGAAVARTRVDDRAAEASYGVIDALTGGKSGPRMPPVATQRAMGAAARGKVHPLYEKAYNTAIDYSAPEGRAIEDIVSRIPAGKAQKAIQSASERMAYDGLPNAQIMASIGDDGKVVFSEMPNVMQLDYIKRAFDEIAEDGKDAVTGKLSSDGAFAARIAKDLREAVKEAVPEYGEALSAASTDIRSRAAVRAGQSLLRPQTTVEDAAEAIADATPAELRAMREGVLGQVDHIMGNVRAVG